VRSLSIIIPVYRDHIALNKLLERISTFKGSPFPIEIIVVDADLNVNQGHAKDGIRYIGALRGRASQLNAGAKLASGDIFWFLHADSLPNYDCLSEISNSVDSGAAGGAFRIKTIVGGSFLFKKVVALADLRSRWTKFPYGDQGIFCTGSAFASLGGYNDFAVFEDYDFSKRLQQITTLTKCRSVIFVSGRRYEQWGLLKSFLIMKGLWLAFLLGVKPKDLARIYKTIR
jgi:rSAM/selenodomain-associated transferase 2